MIYFTLLSLAYTPMPSITYISSDLAMFLFASIVAEKFIHTWRDSPVSEFLVYSSFQKGPTNSITQKWNISKPAFCSIYTLKNKKYKNPLISIHSYVLCLMSIWGGTEINGGFIEAASKKLCCGANY